MRDENDGESAEEESVMIPSEGLSISEIVVDAESEEEEETPYDPDQSEWLIRLGLAVVFLLVVAFTVIAFSVCLSGNYCRKTSTHKKHHSHHPTTMPSELISLTVAPTSEIIPLPSIAPFGTNETTFGGSNIFDHHGTVAPSISPSGSTLFPNNSTTSLVFKNETFLETNNDISGNFSRGTLSGNITDLFLPDNTTSSSEHGLVLDSVRTTPLDPHVKGNCNIRDSLQPHILSQCACEGRITIVAEDIQELYTQLTNTIMSNLYNGEWDEPITSCHPTNQALLWLASGDTRRAGDLVQRYALATIYITLNGTNWEYDNMWLSDQNECLWVGVQCHPETFQINSLEFLPNNDAIATPDIPSEIGLLGGLESLSIANSNITGTIPTYLFSIPSLTNVSLQNNLLTGRIPTQTGLATTLRVLNLEHNDLYGSLPPQLGLLTKLEELHIGSNYFRRALPSELVNCTNLKSLTMDHNRFLGTLPTGIGQWTSLEQLVLTGNVMGGLLPTEIGLWTSMRALQLADNKLSGQIPSEIGLCTDLGHLDLMGQQINGTLPTEFGTLSNLYSLTLSKNAIERKIPSELGKLTNLTNLDLSELHLSGTLPSEIGAMSALEELHLDENSLHGTIPAEICSLRDLQLDTFVVDCPSRTGSGVGIYADTSELLLDLEGNCFSTCLPIAYLASYDSAENEGV